MSMGKRRRAREAPLWVATTELPSAASHPFYARLNQVLREAGFDDVAEGPCGRFYATTVGRPSLAPGIYFRLLMVGYFEGLDSERGIAWRAADSLTLRDVLGLTLPEAPPDHTTMARTRRLIDLETHRAVFTWVLQRLGEAGLVKGQVRAALLTPRAWALRTAMPHRRLAEEPLRRASPSSSWPPSRPSLSWHPCRGSAP